MIIGENNTGKTYMAQYLCDKFKKYYIGMSNDVKSVRNLVEKMIPNSNTVYHFKNFNKASMQAKNALLKITEEPVEGNHIIITGESQIKTLESRAFRFVVSPYSIKELIEYGSKYFDTKFIEEMNKVGIDTPAKMFKYKDYTNLTTVVDLVKNIFNKITYMNYNDIIELINNFDNRVDNYDSTLIFLDALINYIGFQLKNKQLYNYRDILEILITSKRELERTPSLNRKMLLFRTFYQIIGLREIVN